MTINSLSFFFFFLFLDYAVSYVFTQKERGNLKSRLESEEDGSAGDDGKEHREGEILVRARALFT